MMIPIDNSNIIVSLTGFYDMEQRELIESIVKKFGMKFSPDLAETTSILVVESVVTEKYKIAKVYSGRMVCVKKQWLLDSNQSNSLLKVKEYIIVDVFYRLRIHAFGFPIDTCNQIKRIVQRNGGRIEFGLQGTDILAWLKQQQTIDVLVTNQSVHSRIKQLSCSIHFPIVGLQWLNASIRSKVCKFPYDYALNQLDLGRKQTDSHFKKMNNKLQLMLQVQLKINHLQEKDYLNGIFVFMPNLKFSCMIILQKIIVLLGGFYLQQLSPSVTHILLDPLSLNDHNELSQNGLLTHILRIQWLLDSIYLGKKLDESDYEIRCFKQRTEATFEVNQLRSSRTITNGLFSVSVTNSVGVKKSISLLSQAKQLSMKRKAKFDSSIFDGKNFYVESSQRKENELKNISQLIITHKGNLHASRKQIKNGLIYYVLNDSNTCNYMIDSLKKYLKSQSLIQPVSYRWVKQCAAKIMFIDPKHPQSFIYKPLPIKTPIYGYHRFVFEVIGLDTKAKLRLKELYNVLGSVKNIPNRSEITHCLCGQNFKQYPKFHQFRSQSKAIIYLDWKWVIQCANNGKIMDMQPFILLKQDQSLDNISITPQPVELII